MNKLLSIEWMKIRKYRTFWVLLALFAILVPLWNYSFYSGIIKFDKKNLGESFISKSYDFANIWANLSYWASYFVAFISVLMIILTTNEYTFRTKRQNVIDGQTRIQFYHSKWLLVILFSLLTTIYVFIVGFFFGMSAGDLSSFPGKISSLFYLFVLSINYYGFSLLLAVLLKRSGIAIGIFFMYFMFLESLIKGLTNWATKTEFGNLMPLQSSDELIPFPVIEMVKKMASGDDGLSTTVYLTVSIVWIVIYYLIGRFRLLRSDW